MKQIKQIELLEEGYLKLTLTGRKEFDSYMLEQINLHSHTIPCMPKRRSTTIFLYDLSERISLERYLQLYVFQEKEALNFLLQLFEQLVELSKKFPVLLDPAYVYCDVVKKAFYAIVLPIHDREVEQDVSSFLSSLMNQINVWDGEALLGRLLLVTRYSMMNMQDVIDTLQVWKKQMMWLERIRHCIQRLQKERERNSNNDSVIQEELTRMRLLQKSQRYDTPLPKTNKQRSSDTVVLIPKGEGTACLLDEHGKTYVLQDTTMLGRGDDCDVVIAQATISLHHARIKKTTEGYELYDLSSSNGTKVNQKKCKEHQPVLLKHQDQIQLADAKLQFIEEGHS